VPFIFFLLNLNHLFQEFLLRADYSQFEKERDLRAQERKSKQMNGNKK
jgi:hypothetical protein